MEVTPLNVINEILGETFVSFDLEDDKERLEFKTPDGRVYEFYHAQS